ncbi:CatB-related O-acetyltransferase [Pseudomonas sp. sp1636]|uniref:CatB-related O-acetyltransferase n=1 Tax=Pseudomonas sp. sp1636 TaxID=3036707 RepID=UPI0025A5033A|nr:CatB-related O-acetyltransferase [Pseudomonas sp. sp1636]MDM8348425.1 CatB-related O-acetyltransferase [Pseudomonas sp. sp1636]
MLRRHGIKFSPRLADLATRAQLLLEEGVSLGLVKMDFRFLSIGAMSYIRSSAELLNVSRIGRFCSIGSGVILGQDRAGHPLDWVSSHPFQHARAELQYDAQLPPLEVGHDVWIGREAMLLEGIVVGTGAVVAARALVTRDVPPYAIVAGTPAKIIRYRHAEAVIRGLLDSAWWNAPVQSLLEHPLNQPEPFLASWRIRHDAPAARYKRIRLTRAGAEDMGDQLEE